MKLIDLVNARDSLQKLVQQDLPLKTAYKLMQITDECNRHLVFYGNEIAKIDPDKNHDRLDELNDMEIEPFPQEKPKISVDDGLVLSAADVKMLMPLVDFEVRINDL